MSKNKEPYRGTVARNVELIETQRRLENMIRNTIDPAAQAKLRADLREVLDELELYYDDLYAGKRQGMEGQGHE